MADLTPLVEVVDATTGPRRAGMHEGTYTLAASCLNCDWVGASVHTRGYEAKDRSERCPRCACNTIYFHRQPSASLTAETRVAQLEQALREAKNELGVPGLGYPAPIANAVEIIDAALSGSGSRGQGEGARCLIAQ